MLDDSISDLNQVFGILKKSLTQPFSALSRIIVHSTVRMDLDISFINHHRYPSKPSDGTNSL